MCRVDWFYVSGVAAQPLVVPGWAPRSPVCMERSHRPHSACPPRGPRGLAPPSPSLSLTPRNLRPLSSLCKGRPGTEQPVAAYHRPSCPGAHHYLPPSISRWAVSLRIPPHPVGMAWAGPQNCLARAHSNHTQPGGGGQPPLNHPFITHIPDPSTRKCCCTRP